MHVYMYNMKVTRYVISLKENDTLLNCDQLDVFPFQVTPNCRVALRNDSYTLHKILPNKV